MMNGHVRLWHGLVFTLAMGLLALATLAHTWAQSTTQPPLADTYVVSGKPEQSQPADLRVVWVGYNQAAAYGAERALFQFDLATLPVGSTVVSAQLALYLARAEPATDAPMVITVNRLLGAWTETITWNQQANLIRSPAQAVVTTVGTQAGWYQWEIGPLLQSWIDDPARAPILSLLLSGDETSGQRERVFWSKDCKPADCDAQPGKRPQLVIEWQSPQPTSEPTPQPTATFTPLPAPTPTPTPGLAWVSLQNEPHTELTAGSIVTYTITYQNGPHPLSNMRIVNQIPAQVEWFPNRSPLTNGALLTMTGTTPGSLIYWTFPQAILPNQRGELVYHLRRPPLPMGLALTKHGPLRAQPHEPIQYDLVVTNQTTTTVTNLVISDTLPLYAHYLTGGRRVANTVQWEVTSLAPGASVTNTFVVTATQSLINRDYRVQADGGLATVGAVAVVTIIGDGQVPQPLRAPIVHAGGYITWRDHEKTAGLPLNLVYNPSFDLYLPVIRGQ